ncbi:hypothetical protein CRG98_004919 [Punica granatum]|uniref:Uncharacterized protein n=1 Tax=Punica granatum TaxID=22663 RepID=A0A2I0L1K3_PUNGR|nr:hypothetical protein CRG98_004919 [Punica granatum]
MELVAKSVIFVWSGHGMLKGSIQCPAISVDTVPPLLLPNEWGPRGVGLSLAGPMLALTGLIIRYYSTPVGVELSPHDIPIGSEKFQRTTGYRRRYDAAKKSKINAPTRSRPRCPAPGAMGSPGLTPTTGKAAVCRGEPPDTSGHSVGGHSCRHRHASLVSGNSSFYRKFDC